MSSTFICLHMGFTKNVFWHPVYMRCGRRVCGWFFVINCRCGFCLPYCHGASWDDVLFVKKCFKHESDDDFDCAKVQVVLCLFYDMAVQSRTKLLNKNTIRILAVMCERFSVCVLMVKDNFWNIVLNWIRLGFWYGICRGHFKNIMWLGILWRLSRITFPLGIWLWHMYSVFGII